MVAEDRFVYGALLAIPTLAAGPSDSVSRLLLFVGVLTGLLLVSFLVGQHLTGTRSGEVSTSPSLDSDSSDDGDLDSTADPADSAAETEESTVEEVAANEGMDDAETVLALLESAEGQMRQSRIVSRTGWSKTKVSRDLSEMAEEGAIVKVQLGRENLVCLPGHVPSVGREEDR